MSSMLLKAKRKSPPEKAELPPRHGSGAFSSTRTFAPWSRAASDAQSAALPQPTTTTSYFSVAFDISQNLLETFRSKRVMFVRMRG